MRCLIVYCGHEDSTSANGVCVWNIAKELRARGHEVWSIWQYKNVVQREFEKNGVHCYSIGESWYYAFTQWHKHHTGLLGNILYRIISILRLFYVMPMYPNIAPLVTFKSRRLANKIIKENNIERVLGIYMPYHAIDTSMYLKRKYRNSLFVANYHLDLISSPINTNGLVKSYKLWKGKKAVEQELSLIDMMLLPMSAKGIVENEKIRYVDFPLFVNNLEYATSDFVFSTDFVNISYIGSLDKSNRNPFYALSLLKKCSEISPKKIRIHIWGNLTDKETKDIINSNNFVCYHGLLENKYVQDILSRSDYLLNVSNAVTYNMIPSKIFQMFSMHKPIINIVRNEKDASQNYFAKYPNVLNIPEYLPSEDNVKVLRTFLFNKNAEHVIYNDDIYRESTPAYICDFIDGNK